MSAYINTMTGQYPLYQGDIRLEHPEIGDTFELPGGYAHVTVTQPPVHGPDSYAVEGAPVEIEGQWFTTWVVHDLTPEQLAAREEARKLEAQMRPPVTVNEPQP